MEERGVDVDHSTLNRLGRQIRSRTGSSVPFPQTPSLAAMRER